MTNGKLHDRQQRTPMREMVAIMFLILGPLMLVGGAGMIWGWGGVLLLAGFAFLALGVTMGFSRTGKG